MKLANMSVWGCIIESGLKSSTPYFELKPADASLNNIEKGNFSQTGYKQD